MKQVYFTIIFLILYSLNGTTQNVSFPGREELLKLKKELSTYHRIGGNEKERANPIASQNDIKSVQGDFGNPPGWDWVKTYGGTGKDVSRELIVNEDGSILVAGSFSGEISLGSNNYSSVGRRDAFLAKFDNNGSLNWFKQFSPLLEENKIDIYGLCTDESGNIHMTGYYTGAVSFGDFDLDDNNEVNLFLVSAGSDGQITMATNHTTNNPKEMGLKVDTDDNGNIYVLGSTDGTNDRQHPSVIIKYSPTGSMLFEYFHAQNFSDMQIFGEHIYYTGTINSADYIGNNYFEPARWSAFIAQSNLNMEFVWSYMIESDDSYAQSHGTGLFISSSEEVFFIGSSISSQYDITLGSLSTYIYGGFVSKIMPSGEVLWMYEILEHSADIPIDITGSDNRLFISSSIGSFYVVTKCYASTGAYITRLITDYKTESLTYNAISNSVILSQNMNEQISLSMYTTTSLEQEWNVLFGGNSALTYGIGMGMDHDGFIYNYGYTSNQINHSGQIINKGLFLTKQDGSGNTVWAQQFADAKDNSKMPGNYMTVDTNTNSVYITGTFYPLFFIPDGPTLISDYPGSIFILKYNFDGVFQWAIQEDFQAEHLCLATDYSGNLLLSGVYIGTINIGSTTLTSDSHKIFIAKYDNAGQHIWAKSVGGEWTERTGLISCDAQDNIYLTVECESPVLYIDDIHLTPEDGDGNILLAKFNSEGTAQWASMKGGSLVQWGDYYGSITGIITDSEGNSYVKGWHADSTFFDNIMLSSPFEKPGYNNKYNKFVAKFDNEGNTIWAKTMSELAASVDYNQFDIDQNGNVYSGYGVRDTSVINGEYTYINTSNYDLLFTKYSNNGNLNWVKSIKGSENGTALVTSIVANNPETVYINGWFNDYLNFGSSSIVINNKNSFIGLLEGTSAIEENYYNETVLFTLFPNPARGLVNIQTEDNNLGETDIFITDVSGRNLFSQHLSKNQQKTTIDISELSPGIYFVKLKSGKKVGVKKLVID